MSFNRYETTSFVYSDGGIELETPGIWVERKEYKNLEEAEKEIGRERFWQDITLWGGRVLKWGGPVILGILGINETIHTIPNFSFSDSPVAVSGAIAAFFTGFYLVDYLYTQSETDGFIKSREQWLKNYKKTLIRS